MATLSSIIPLPAAARTRTSFTATAGQTTFNFTYVVGFLEVFLNGVLLNASDLTATNGTSFTLNVAVDQNDIVEAITHRLVSIGTASAFAGTLPVANGGTGTTSATFVDLTSNVTSTLPVANGGTGVTTSTGSGNVVLSTSPVLTTPNLGTPSAVVLTNATGTASNLTANVANFITVTDDVSTNATRYLVFANDTSGAVVENVSSTKLTFNPSSGMLTSTDYNSSSDMTLKQDITPIQNPLDIISQLTGFGFTWKDSKQKSYGLSAQEVEKIIPEIVRDRADGTKGINYMNLTAFLIEAIKDLKQEIVELKKPK